MSLSVAMVTFAQHGEIEPQDLVRALASDWPALGTVEGLEESKGILSFKLGQDTVFLAPMPVPIPWADLEEACRTSMLWPKAATELRDHTMHMIVTVTSDAGPMQCARLLTQVIASASSVCSAINGVYWGDAWQVIPIALFREFAIEMLDKGPLHYIWVSYRVGADPRGGTSGFTHGLHGLGLMDFEVECCGDTVPELRQRLENMAIYLLENGLVIKDGNTVGGDEKERIRVSYADSAFGNESKVIRLNFEEIKKPFWKVW